MALDLGISLKVETSSLEEAMKKVNALGDAVGKVGKDIKSSTTGTSKATQESNRAIERSAKTVDRSTRGSIDLLQRYRLISQFLAGDFTKGEASILATGKAAGLSNKQMEELEKTLKQIFKLSGKNPFDDSVNPLRRLTAESEKLVNKMKVLRGETVLTAKQMEELSIVEARAEAAGRNKGLRGAALQSSVNKSIRDYIDSAKKLNEQTAEYNNAVTEQQRRVGAVAGGFTNALKNINKVSKDVSKGFTQALSGIDKALLDGQMMMQAPVEQFKRTLTSSALTTAFSNIKQTSKNVAEGFDKALIGLKNVNDAGKDMVSLFKKDQFDRVFKGLNIAIPLLNKNIKDISTAMDGPVAKFKEMERIKISSGFSTALKNIKNTADQVSKGFDNALVNISKSSIAGMTMMDGPTQQFKNSLRELTSSAITTALGNIKKTSNDVSKGFTTALSNIEKVKQSVSSGLTLAFKNLNDQAFAMAGPVQKWKETSEKSVKLVNKLLEETALKAKLAQQGLTATTANAVVRLIRQGASESQIQEFIASRKAIEGVSEAKKKLAETSSATYQAIVEGNKKAKFHIDGLQAAVRAVIPGFGALSAVAIGSTVIAGAIRMADAYTALQSRIKLTGVTSEQLQIVNERLLRISNESRTSLAENTQLYVKLANALKNFGGTSVDALNVTSAFSKALVIGGANTREASAATLQFAQALGSGKLAGDEFRSIAEASPRVLKAIADGSGIAADKLKKMASEGMLTTSVVAKALISQLAVLEAEMLSLTPTIGQAFQVLTNNTTSLIGKLNEATGFTRAVAEGVLGLANSIPTADQVIKTVTDSIRGFGKILQENKDLIEGFVGSLITVAAPFVVMKTVTIASTLAFAGLSATIKAGTAIMAAYRGVMIAVALAGGGLTGAMTLLTAAMTLFAKNRAVLVLTTLGSVLAYAFSDQISAMIQKVTDKLSGFNSEVEKTQNAGERLGVGARSLVGNELQRKLEEIRAENIKTKKLLGMDLTKEEKSSEKKSEAQGYSDVRDFVKDQINLLKQRKDLTEEQFQSEARNIVALAEQLKLKQDLAKVSLTESKDDKKGIFNLANINRLYETEIQQSNKLFDFRRDLIDKNLQYELVTAGVAEIQKQRLAEETYNRERELLKKQLKEVSALKPNAKLGSDQFETQKEAIETQKKVLEEKIKTLDIDRQRTVEIAKVVALGESERRAFEANRDIRKIEADILEDINKKQQEFNNRFADPAVLAAQQARAAAADKYTQKIAEAQAQLIRINNTIEGVLNDEELLTKASNERAEVVAIINRLLEDQAILSNKAFDAEKKRVEQSRSLEEGFNRASRNRLNDLNDLSKVSENFMNGFYSSFDAALEKSVKDFKFKFGTVFKFIRDEIKKILVQQLVLKPIKAIVTPIIDEMGKAMLGFIYQAAATAFSSFLASSKGTSGLSDSVSLLSKVGNFFKSGITGITAALETSIIKLGDYLSTSQSDFLAGIGESIQGIVGSSGGVSGALSTAGMAAAAVAAVFASYKINRLLAGGYEVGGVAGNVFKNMGAVGGLINGLFGKKKVVTGQGIQGEFTSQGFTGTTFADIEERRRFRSTKRYTVLESIPKEFNDALNSAVVQVSKSIVLSGRVLGVNLEDFVNNFKTSGRFSSDFNTALNQFGDSVVMSFFGTLSESAQKFLDFLKEFRGEGEGLAVAFAKATAAIQGVNNLITAIGNQKTSFDITNAPSSLGLIKSLQDDNFSKAVDFYIQNFANKADIFKAKSDAFNFQVQQLGLSLDEISSKTTKEQFSGIIQNLDLTIESNQVLFGQLIALAPALKEIIDLRAQEGAAIEQQVETVEQAYARLKTVIKTNEDIAQERISLEEELFNLTASAIQIRQRERETLDESNRALFDQIKAIEDQRVAAEEATRVAEELAAAQERILEERVRLEEQLFNLTASATQIRQKERNALDASNRALFDQIKALEDQKIASEKATEAARESAEALERLRGFGKTIREFINSIRFQNSSPSQNLSSTRVEFQRVLSLTSSSDQTARDTALQSIPDVAQSYLDVAKQYFGSSSAYQRIQEDVLRSLESLPAVKSFDEQQVELLKQIASLLDPEIKVALETSVESFIKKNLEVIETGTLTEDAKKLLVAESETITKTLEAANLGNLSEDSKKLLVAIPETITKTVQALNLGELTEDSKILIRATGGIIDKTVRALNDGTLSSNSILLLNSVSSTIQRTVQALNSGTLSTDSRNLLSAVSSNILKTVEAAQSGTLTGNHVALLTAATSTITKTLAAAQSGTLSADHSALLSEANETITKTLAATGGALTADQSAIIKAVTGTTTTNLDADVALNPNTDFKKGLFWWDSKNLVTDVLTGIYDNTFFTAKNTQMMYDLTFKQRSERLIAAQTAYDQAVAKQISEQSRLIKRNQATTTTASTSGFSNTDANYRALQQTLDAAVKAAGGTGVNYSFASAGSHNVAGTFTTSNDFEFYADGRLVGSNLQINDHQFDTFVGTADGHVNFGDKNIQITVKRKVAEIIDSSFQKAVDTARTELIAAGGTVASALGNVFSGGTVVPFANGGVFTNSIATRPTITPMALFGEAGPEAIMPLKRGPNGSLGVVSYGSNSVDTSPLIAELCARVEHLTRVVQTYAKADLETSSEMLMEQKKTSKSMRQAAESQD